MQQRGTNTTMNFDCEEKTSPPQVRGRVSILFRTVTTLFCILLLFYSIHCAKFLVLLFNRKFYFSTLRVYYLSLILY